MFVYLGINQYILHDMEQEQNFINTDTLCERLSVTRQTVAKWRKEGTIPFIQVGQVVRYNYAEVVEALKGVKG